MPRVTAESGKRQPRSGLAFFFRRWPKALLLGGIVVLGMAACSRPAPSPSAPPSAVPPSLVDASCAARSDRLESGRVTHVVDGDTVHLANGDKVRLIGVNSPEMSRDGRPPQPLAEEATAALRGLLGSGGRVQLQDGRDARDRYGRRLAHLFDSSGQSIEARLLRQGLGFHVAVAPNFEYLECLQAAEGEAMAAGRGVWSERRYAPRSIARLDRGQGGFALVRDRVTRVSFKDNGWWVQLGGKLGLRIDRAGQALFDRRQLKALEGRTVTVRGWLVPRDDWWQMNLTHPAMLAVEP